MNRKLADDISKRATLPECIEEFFDYGIAVCCAFNRFGTLLATGTSDGYIGIWDFETRGLAKVLPDGSPPEACPVTSVCWSRNGRYLLSGQKNKHIILWDVLEGKQLHEVLLPSAVEHVSLSPHKPFTAVVSLQSGPPMLVELTDSPVLTPLDTSINLKAVIGSSGPQKQRGGSDQQPMVAVLSSSGREVFVGLQQSNRGFLLVYDTDSKQLLDVYKLPAAVVSMRLAGKGDLLVLSCSDKALRLVEVQERPADAQPVSKEQAEATLNTRGPGALGSQLLGEPHSLISLWPIVYQNIVEKGAWLGAAISHDGKHVVGAAASNSNHRLYIWEKSRDKLVCILEGPSSVGMADLAWHPWRPLMVTIAGNSKGQVYIWAPVYNENWSAFAPDFKELDENQEYVEAEDEFDINQRPSPPRNDADAELDVEIDIMTREPLPLYGETRDDDDASQEDEEEALIWLPAEVDVSALDKEGTDQQQSSGDASDDEAGPEASGRAGAGAESDGAGTDQPRERKRKVRFQKEEEDDDAFEDLLQRQQQQGNKAGPKGARPGLPPLPRPPKDEAQGGLPVAGQPQPAGGRGPKASGVSGSALNPTDTEAGAYGPNSVALLGASSSSKSLLEHQVQLQRQHMEQQQQDLQR